MEEPSDACQTLNLAWHISLRPITRPPAKFLEGTEREMEKGWAKRWQRNAQRGLFVNEVLIEIEDLSLWRSHRDDGDVSRPRIICVTGSSYLFAENEPSSNKYLSKYRLVVSQLSCVCIGGTIYQANRRLLPLEEAIASRAVFVIVSFSDGRAETLLEPAK